MADKNSLTAPPPTQHSQNFENLASPHPVENKVLRIQTRKVLLFKEKFSWLSCTKMVATARAWTFSMARVCSDIRAYVLV